MSAAELARAIAEKRISAAEVVDDHLRRIEAVDGAVNAVVQIDERCVEQARAADAATGPRGPLHGVPFTVKDNLSAAGVPMAIGAPERAGVVPVEDATVVARMRAAGAILLGKTNCPPYGGGIETDNPIYGRTNNPYDLERTPGGSSGGEAAAVAAEISPCGIGTDSGGSLRIPAHFCGVATLKPTAGLVPVTGVIDDLGQIGAMGDPRTQVGPIARSAADVGLLLRVIAGPDGRDGGCVPVPVGEPAAVAGLRVAVSYENDVTRADAETVATVEAAAAALGEAGAAVREAPHPRGGHELTLDVWRSYGEGVPAEELYGVLRRWDAFRTAMLEFGRDHDLILCPVFPEPAVLHGDTARPGQTEPSGFTTPHSLTGWPAATVRCGTSGGGLPIGVQVVAGPWRDHVALAAALQLERALGGWAPAQPQ